MICDRVMGQSKKQAQKCCSLTQETKEKRDLRTKQGGRFIFVAALFAWLVCPQGFAHAAPLNAWAVSTPEELESAFGNPNATEIQLLNDIKLNKNLTLNHNIVIHGGGNALDLGAFKLNAGAHSLSLADTLGILANDSKTGSTLVGTGKFIVEENANIFISRAPGIYKTNLIEGFSEYLFKRNSSFHAQAGTNQAESNKGTAQTGIIRSFPAQSFVVERGAAVALVSDYSSAKAADHGSTALILRKPRGGELNIEVQEGALLEIVAYGTGLKTRDRAPVLILHEPVNGNTGVSKTLIQGALNVTSNNGNGWYYQYIDYVTNTSDFFVVDGGEVNILARNGGSKDKTEYAAFESYGRNPTYIVVENGGIMNVIGNGYRGMSLAGGGSYAEKSIVVKGVGSKLKVYGYMWAIAAETQPTLLVSAMDGGEILLESSVDNLGNVAFPGSTVYAVGPTTFHVDGPGSKMELFHRGGEYGAIFADGYGELKIHVTRGGNMYVYSKNSGSNKAARRAAICAQSGLSNVHSIVIDGDGSVLEVINDDPEKTNDHSLYPRSAIAFAANTSGNIVVRNGGSLFAINNDPDSPTIALGGYGTNDTQGKLTVDSPRTVDIANEAARKNPYAVALRSTNYLQNKKGDAKKSLEVKDASITTWPIGNGAQGWPEAESIDRWYSGSEPFVVPNNVEVIAPFAGSKGNTSFKLSDYGRIVMKATVQRMEINEGDIRVRIDQTGQLTVSIFPEWAEIKVVHWTSSDTNIADIDEDGVVTPYDYMNTRWPHNLGFTTVTVTATDGSGKSASCEVEVYTIPVTVIELIPEFPTSGDREGVEYTKTAILRARIHPADAVEKRIDWQSSDPSVLSVTPLGDRQAVEQRVELRALQRSDTPIVLRATAWDNYGATSSLAVKIYFIPVTSIGLNKTSATLYAGETQQLSATVEPRDATIQSLQWVSLSPDIASVDNEGNVTAHAAGTAEIRAIATDGTNVFASCFVTVSPTTYTVLIKTIDQHAAGTNSRIYLTLEGTNGRSPAIYLNPHIHGDAFEENDLDVVTLFPWHVGSADLGDIQGITIRSDGSGAMPAWYVRYVRVIRNETQVSEFEINTALTRSRPSVSRDSPDKTYNIRSHKPIYIIGHRANDKEDIEQALEHGANAVEIDIQYDPDTDIFYVDHDRAGGTKLDEWLTEAARVANRYGDRFALVYFDIKGKNPWPMSWIFPSGGKAPAHLDKLIQFVHNHPDFSKVNLNVIYSVPEIEYAGKFKAKDDKGAYLYSTLKPNEGFNIDDEAKPEDVRNFYRDDSNAPEADRINMERCWYGYGIYTGIGLTGALEDAYEGANAHRGNGDGRVKKTVAWTFSEKKTAVQILNKPYTVDAIITNFGGGNSGSRLVALKHILSALYEHVPEKVEIYSPHSLRLATRRDDPFYHNSQWY